jgi:hypothetical protein
MAAPTATAVRMSFWSFNFFFVLHNAACHKIENNVTRLVASSHRVLNRIQEKRNIRFSFAQIENNNRKSKEENFCFQPTPSEYEVERK